jgi:hypothetical protein
LIAADVLRVLPLSRLVPAGIAAEHQHLGRITTPPGGFFQRLLHAVVDCLDRVAALPCSQASDVFEELVGIRLQVEVFGDVARRGVVVAVGNQAEGNVRLKRQTLQASRNILDRLLDRFDVRPHGACRVDHEDDVELLDAGLDLLDVLAADLRGGLGDGRRVGVEAGALFNSARKLRRTSSWTCPSTVTCATSAIGQAWGRGRPSRSRAMGRASWTRCG